METLESILGSDLDDSVAKGVRCDQFMKWVKKFNDNVNFYHAKSALNQDLAVGDAVIYHDGVVVRVGLISQIDDRNDGLLFVSIGTKRTYSIRPYEAIKINSYEDGIKIIKMLLK